MEVSSRLPTQRLVAHWAGISPGGRLALTGVVTGATFLLLLFLPRLDLLSPLSLAVGLTALVLIPGSLLNSVVLPQDLHNLWTNLLMGLVLVVIESHLLLLLTALRGPVSSLGIWLLLMSAIISFVLYTTVGPHRRARSHEALFNLGVDSALIRWLAIGISVRVVLLFLAQGCIAPDAALYADYAENITAGVFRSDVQGDYLVTAYSDTVDLIPHQGVSYVFALSFLLVDPSLFGPSPILVILGLALIYLVYRIALQMFGQRAAELTAVITSVHPLLVFFSVVPYGSEITSLSLLLFVWVLLADGLLRRVRSEAVAGVVVGVVESIWMPNFYIFFATLVFVTLALRRESPSASLQYAVVGISIFVVWVASESLIIPLALVLLVLLLALAERHRLARAGPLQHALVTFLPVVGYLWWFYSLQAPLFGPSVEIAEALRQASHTHLLWNGGFNYSFLLGLIPSPGTVLALALFTLFHLSIPVFYVWARGLWVRRRDGILWMLVLCVVVVLGGTAVILEMLAMEKSVLTPYYVYSDARFLLSPVTVALIPIGWLLDSVLHVDTAESSTPSSSSGLSPSPHSIHWNRRAILVILLIGFVPGYVAYPVGLNLTNSERFYSWTGLRESVDELGDPSSVFLTDRAREFAWWTGRQSAFLVFKHPDEGTTVALRELTSLVREYNASFLVLDWYSQHRWPVLSPLYEGELTVGDTLPVDVGSLRMYLSSESAPDVLSMREVVVLPESEQRPAHVRVFRFLNATFERRWYQDNLADGWTVDGPGALYNNSLRNVFRIEGESGVATLHRSSLFDLSVGPGFVVCKIVPGSAEVLNVTAYDSRGRLIDELTPIGEGYYLSVFDGAGIGDLRVTIGGDPGDSVKIGQVAVWSQAPGAESQRTGGPSPSSLSPLTPASSVNRVPVVRPEEPPHIPESRPDEHTNDW